MKYFKKCVLAPLKVLFSGIYIKICEEDFFKLVRVRIKKNKSLPYNLKMKVKKLLYFNLICSFRGWVGDIKIAEC